MSDRDPFALSGTTIDGKYRVEAVVGEGGFGVVYKGVHEGLDVPVAIKCLKLPPHFDLATQEVLVKQLREEGRMLLRLSQRTPGILQALDAGSTTTPSGARVPYLILEWLEGRTLAEEVRGRPGMSLGEAYARLDPAAQALAVAHEEKIAHRDIKPENLFCIESRGKPTIKILDFGIAKLLDEAASPTSGTALGGPSMFTPSYGAPEQFDKKRGATGPWTDVFAFALVFVELVTGRPALEGDSVFALFNASSDPASRPTPRARGVASPEAIERVLEKALEPDPSKRYPDIGSFWGALEAAIKDAGGESEAFSDRVSVPVRRSSALFDNAKTVAATPDVVTPDVVTPDVVTAPTTRIEATTTARSQGTPPRRALLTWLRLGIGLAGLGIIGVGVTRSMLASSSPSAEVASAAPAISVHVATPVSNNPAAVTLYSDAMQAWHDGALEAAIRGMEQAIVIDPQLGAAQIRLALWHFMAGGAAKQVEGREHFTAAMLHRNALGELDKGLVNAAEPYMRQPWDLDEWGKRLEALTQKFPTDVELLVYLGAALQTRLDPNAAIAAYDRALAIDRTLVAARLGKGDSLATKGATEAQLAEYDACLATAPVASQCLLKRTVLRAQLGDCPAMKLDAQRLVSMDPVSAGPRRQLAMALDATGSPRDSVLEAIERSWSFEMEGDRKAIELQDRAALAAIAGDFDEARARLEEWQSAVADKPDQSAHATPAQRLAELYTEMGLPKKASDVADAFLRRMNAWSEPGGTSYAMLFLSYRLRAGAVTPEEYGQTRTDTTEKLRAKWKSAGRKVDEDFAWLAWSVTYGAEVADEADARAAAEAMPKARSTAMDSGRSQAVDLSLGRTYALVGPAEKALPPLHRVGSPCLVLLDPVARTWAQFYLGMALESTGNKDGAARAYRGIIDRWGKAKPRSITAEQAKKRLAALGDAKKKD